MTCCRSRKEEAKSDLKVILEVFKVLSNLAAVVIQFCKSRYFRYLEERKCYWALLWVKNYSLYFLSNLVGMGSEGPWY